eukprot:TRINITY_DN272_c0_g1_i1.p1 TRINITY_DN272_c0_g1~~TRINITY_DN272_c0_g1_i1.p1  ORF type:complete len:199 (-),score=39.31 TRINITY_DN272_c0_g1_i1:397-993(-)
MATSGTTSSLTLSSAPSTSSTKEEKEKKQSTTAKKVRSIHATEYETATSTANSAIARLQQYEKECEDFAAVLESDEDDSKLTSWPNVAQPTKAGILQKKSDSKFWSSFSDHYCVLSDGWFYWAPKKDKPFIGGIKFVKSRCIFEVADGMLQFTCRNRGGKVFLFKPTKGQEFDIEDWVDEMRKAKLAYIRGKKQQAKS